MEWMRELKLALAAAVGALTGFWGWFGWLVVGWVVCMIMDYLTGSAAAAKMGVWSSAQAREGVWHKAGMIVVVLVAAGADLLIGAVLAHLPVAALPIPYTTLVCPIVLVWYIITELGSISENALAMGAPIPGWLTRLLLISREAIDSAGEQLTGGDSSNVDRP